INMGDHTKNKLYMSHNRDNCKGGRQCRVTGRRGGMGLVRKYGINMKRQTFRELAIDIGFKKYN
ncbi:hypothetical protein TrCOL_g11249, partial [Triparma columacea]